ncbi:MAG: hypothetical protein K2J39_07215 [Ruminococcus sp.]|nr:hypothetical protein [Ruminococcus sp.]
MTDEDRKNSDSGITREYTGNRNLWDDKKAKENYKDYVFGENKTITDSKGTVIHRDSQSAKNKYHMKNADGENISTAWARHTAETDHKISLKSLHSHAKNNPFLSDSDLKEIANTPENFQILSKSENASKSADNSATFADHAVMHGKFAQKTAQNVAGKFTEGAVESVKGSAMNIITESLNKLLIEGESLEDTLDYAGEAVIDTAIEGGKQQVMEHLRNFLAQNAEQILAESGNKLLSSIVAQNGIGQILVLGTAIGDSTLKYINGEITDEQFAGEILLNGLAVGISAVVSTSVPFLAPVIMNIAVKVADMINQTNRSLNSYLLNEAVIKKISREAVAEMEYQRIKFHELVQKDLDKWDSTVEDAFRQLIMSSSEDSFNLEGMVAGLDKVLSLCGEKAEFHSLNEWENQLDMTLKLSF